MGTPQLWPREGGCLHHRCSVVSRNSPDPARLLAATQVPHWPDYAMVPGGELHISTRKKRGSTGDGIETIIRDEGAGIDQKHLHKIYEPFFTTKGDRGTGIGLWVVKQLVEKRGGQIAITSNTETGKRGTAVTIFLPFALPATLPCEGCKAEIAV